MIPPFALLIVIARRRCRVFVNNVRFVRSDAVFRTRRIHHNPVKRTFTARAMFAVDFTRLKLVKTRDAEFSSAFGYTKRNAPSTVVGIRTF